MELSQEQKFKFRYRLEQEQAGSSVDTQPKEQYKQTMMDTIMPSKQYQSSLGLTPEKLMENRQSILPMAGAMIGGATPSTMALGAGAGESANQAIRKFLPNQKFIPGGEANFGLNPLTDPIAQNAALTYAGGKAIEAAPTALKAVKGFVSKYAPSNIKQAVFNMSEKGIRPFANKVQNALVDAFHSKGEEFGNAINNLSDKNMSTPTNVSSAITSLINESQSNPKVASLINRVPKLKSFIESFASDNSVSNMTLKESQELLKSIKSEFSHSKLSGQGIRYNELPIFKDVMNEIRIAQFESLPQELQATFKGALKDYGQAANDYRMIKTSFNDNNFSSTLKTSFGGNTIKKVAAKSLIPNEMAQMDTTRNVANVISGAKKALVPSIALEEFLRRKYGR